MYKMKVKAAERKSVHIFLTLLNERPTPRVPPHPRASIIGVDPSPRELDGLQKELDRQLLKFDSEQVLAGWDALVFKQQQALKALNVPTMFATTTEVDRERQQRIIQIISDTLDEHPS